MVGIRGSRLKTLSSLAGVRNDGIRLRVAGKNWHCGSKKIAGEHLESLPPVPHRHREIHDDQIGEPGPGFVYGLLGVSRLVHDEAPERRQHSKRQADTLSASEAHARYDAFTGRTAPRTASDRCPGWFPA
jgi:hypothetical protein